MVEKFLKDKRIKLLIKVFFIFLICFILPSCLEEVKQEITIHEDGSGNARCEIVIQKEMLPFASYQISQFKKELKEKGWDILPTVEKEGKYVISVQRKFKDISELNDDEATYTFSSKKIGFMKSSYILQIKYIKSSDIPFPYEIYIKLPGSIYETNGEKVSSNKVKWTLLGFSKGTVLYVKSSGLAMPVLVWLAIGIGAFLLVFVAVIVRSKIIK